MEDINSWNTIFVIIELVVSLLGILFNGLVIFTICKNIYRLSSSSYFILSIALSDFLSCSVAVPLAIARHFQKKWPFGMGGCQAHAFMIFLLALVSITHLAVISAGKYLTITRSLSRESYFNKRNALLIIMASWLYSFGFSVAPLLGWSRYGLEGTGFTCSVKWESSLPGDKAYFGIVFLGCYVLPMTVITICYYKINKVSKQVVVTTSHFGTITMTITQALLKKRRMSAMYFFIIIASFLLAWTPYAVVSFLTVLGRTFNPIAISACSVFAKTSFFLNPILYAMVSRKFRQRVIRAFPPSRSKREVRPAWLSTNSFAL